LRPRAVAVDDAQDPDAVAAQHAGGHLAALAGADEQHPAVGERAERLACELDRGRGDRYAAAADRGAGPRPAPGGERVADEAVEQRATRPGAARELVGAAQLAEDLGLAQHHRL